MADLERTVEIIFKSIDQTGTGLTSVSSKLNDFERSVGNISAPLASLAGDIVKTETAILSLAAAYGGYAVTQAAKFETAQIDLQKVLGNGESIDNYTQTVKNLSETYGITSTNILQGIANFKQAGFSADEAAKLQKNALDLVISGDLEAGQASEQLVRILKGQNAAFSDASRFIEAMNNVSNQYGTSLGELSNGMSAISPILKTMGFSFEQGVGAITPIIESFGSGTEAANALKVGLLRLIDDSKPVQDALKAIGVSQKDANGELRSAREIYLDVGEAFKGLTKEQKAFFSGQLFGKEQSVRLVSLFNNMDTAASATSEALKQTGSVANEVSLRLDSAEKQVDKFKVTFENLAIAVGGQVLDNFKGIAGGATEINKSFEQVVNNGGLAPLFNALKPLLSDFEETLRGIAKALPDAFKGVDFDWLIASFRNLGGEIGDIFGGLDLTDADDLEKALQGIIDFISLLTNATAGVVQGFSPFIDGIKALLSSLGNGDSEFVSFVGNVSGLGAAVNQVLPLLKFLGDALGALADVLIVVTGARAFGSLSPAVLSAAKSFGAFLPVAAAAVSAFKAIQFAIDENVKAYQEYKDRTDLSGTIANTNENLEKQRAKLKEISDETGVTVTSIDELEKAMKSGAIVADDSALGYSSAGDAIDELGNQSEKLGDSTVDASKALKLLGLNANGVKDEIADVSQETSSAAESEDEWIKTIENGQTVYTHKTRALAESKSTIRDVVKATNELSEAEKIAVSHANDMEKTLAKLASNEKIKAIEFSAKIQVASIEADAKKVTQAFKSISEEIVSTNSLIDSLTSQLGNNNLSTFDKFKIDDQINAANKRADEILRQQDRLNEAEIRLKNARAKQIEDGGSVIKVYADNLAPELQALLESLVNNIRIQAIIEGTNFITG